MGNDWNYNVLSPKRSGEYEVIGESLNGTVLKEVVSYSTDDGWQIGNNWDILLWRELSQSKSNTIKGDKNATN